jgi:phage gp36-like protein
MKIPTVDDFILFYGEIETLELSRLDNPDDVIIDRDKIQLALNNALDFILSYEALCNTTGKIAIRRASSRLILEITRYLLDHMSRRPDVTSDYEKCIDFLNKCVDTEEVRLPNLTTEEMDELGVDNFPAVSYTPGGPRVFNREQTSGFRNQRFW